MVPLMAAAIRALLGKCELSIHLVGPTGVFKTELAALIQQCYGPAMDALHLPAAWSSTANALEGMAFLAKDAVLVVDDLAPGGSATEVSRIHREAGRVFRAQGNRSARRRMRPDATLRPAKPPRGLLLSTGEDVPIGQSIRARVNVIEVNANDIDAGKLSECQADAAAGLYASMTAGFVRWLAVGTKIKPSGIAAHIGRLSAVAAVSDAETKEAISEYLGLLETATSQN